MSWVGTSQQLCPKIDQEFRGKVKPLIRLLKLGSFISKFLYRRFTKNLFIENMP